MIKHMSRQQLYDLVWERPVSKLARELGLSDVGLRKQCVKYGIPLPGNSYWGKRQHGKSANRTPLGEPPPDVGDRIAVGTSWIRPSLPAAEITSAVEKAKSLPTANELPAVTHVIVTKTLQAARRALISDRGVAYVRASQLLALTVAPASFERAERLLNALVSAAIAKGYRFHKDEEALVLRADGEDISFRLSQRMRQTPHIVTDEEREARSAFDKEYGKSWDHWYLQPKTPKFDYHPAELIIEIGWQYEVGAPHRFRDSASRKLEDRVEEIVLAFPAHAAAIKLRRREGEERRKSQELAVQRRAQAAYRARIEEQRDAYLARKLGQYRDLQQLTDFLAYVGADPAAEDTNYRRFQQWLTEKRDRLARNLSREAMSAELDNIDAFEAIADGPSEGFR